MKSNSERIAGLHPGITYAYTDGSCLRNPGGPCGAGVLLVRDDPDGQVRREISRRVYDGDTNNVAELAAILIALESTDPERPLIVCSDSTYALGAASGAHRVKANREIVRAIRDAARGRHVEWRHVPGHAGHPAQERAHDLAVSAARRGTNVSRGAA